MHIHLRIGNGKAAFQEAAADVAQGPAAHGVLNGGLGPQAQQIVYRPVSQLGKPQEGAAFHIRQLGNLPGQLLQKGSMASGPSS